MKTEIIKCDDNNVKNMSEKVQALVKKEQKKGFVLKSMTPYSHKDTAPSSYDWVPKETFVNSYICVFEEIDPNKKIVNRLKNRL